jgi:hypothetical protein
MNNKSGKADLGVATERHGFDLDEQRQTDGQQPER